MVYKRRESVFLQSCTWVAFFSFSLINHTHARDCVCVFHVWGEKSFELMRTWRLKAQQTDTLQQAGRHRLHTHTHTDRANNIELLFLSFASCIYICVHVCVGAKSNANEQWFAVGWCTRQYILSLSLCRGKCVCKGENNIPRRDEREREAKPRLSLLIN